VLEAAYRRQVQDEAQMESEFLSLWSIEQAVLWRLLEQGSRFRPCNAAALKFYTEKLNAPGQRVVKVTAQTAQNTVEAIRQRSPGAEFGTWRLLFRRRHDAHLVRRSKARRQGRCRDRRGVARQDGGRPSVGSVSSAVQRPFAARLSMPARSRADGLTRPLTGFAMPLLRRGR